MKGTDIIVILEKFIGRTYVLGAFAPKNDPHYKGPFDCAEFQSYGIFQAYGFLYGTDTHDIKKAGTADAYTGYFAKDVENLGELISPEEATRIPGALLLRKPKPGAIGHIVCVKPKLATIEANSTKYGCGNFGVSGRRWDCGILLPGVNYDAPDKLIKSVAPELVYRLKEPFMQGDFVKQLQRALGISDDGTFGLVTHSAVVAYQKNNGLIVDGEVMPGGQTAKSLNIK